jgi:two-component system, OmpR family, phosphate regulon sensor histidine kinase PhoR
MLPRRIADFFSGERSPAEAATPSSPSPVSDFRMQDLEQARSRFEALLAASNDAIVALDAAGSVRYQNPAARALFGGIEGKPFPEVVRDPALTNLLRSKRFESSIAAGTQAIEGDSILLHLEEHDRWMQATVTPIAGGGDWLLALVLRDVSETRRAEAARRDFVANVSHELRTPLAGIKAVVETLRDGALEDREAADQFLGQVDGEVDRLTQLVEELLELARVESGAEITMTAIEPAEVLEGAVERFLPQGQRSGVDLSLDLADDLPDITGNERQLGQAVGNLIHNALKFTPPGGRVSVSARVRGEQLEIQVADTGSGIDPADLPRIFERFYVADRARAGKGTGLGLAIVKHVARLHGGTVGARSTLGAGSCFTIALPIDPAPHSTPE